MSVNRLHFLTTLLCFLPFVGASCAVTTPSEINHKYAAVLQERQNHYRLKPGDQISIQLYNLESDLDQEQSLILPDGRSDLFHMHDYKLAGKTVEEFEEDLREELVAELRNQVTEVRIQVTPAQEFVYLVGEFSGSTSSRMPFTEKMTLQEAIATAGGMRLTGDTDWALLRRPYLDPRHPDRFRVDLNDESEALFLLPGDQIVLGRTWFASVGAYLREYLFGIFSPTSSAFQTAAYASIAF